MDIPTTDVASCLRQNFESIMREWSRRARREIPAAAAQSEEDLRNTLPEILAKLIEGISTTSAMNGREKYTEETIALLREHGSRRARKAEYTLDQVIAEHRLLREVVLNVLEKDQPLARSDHAKVLEVFDHALVQAATEFTDLLGFDRARVHKEIEAQTRDLKVKLDSAREETKELQKQRDESRHEIGSLQEERELREKFVSTLTHDLRTPLTSAKAAADLISRQSDNAALCRDLAKRIKNDIDRSDRMVRDLLDANRIRAGEKIPIKVARCELRGVVKETLEELKTLHGDRFVLRGENSVEGVWDCGAIRRMIENLCGNAIKYGCPRSPVTVSLNQDSRQVEIAIHNEGEPISREDQTSLFRQFRRAHAAQASGKKGWGIGLTLVRGVAESHGGNVKVKSAAGKGTTFMVTLPLDARSSQRAG